MNDDDGWSPELGVLRVAAPCAASWEKMTGDDRVRFCARCRLDVYNLSAMTSDEARTLLLEREGRLCVRFYRRADGRMLTRDCPVGLRARLRARWAAAVAAVLAVLSAFGLTRPRSTVGGAIVDRSLLEPRPIPHPARPGAAPPKPPDDEWISDRRARLGRQDTVVLGRMYRDITVIRGNTTAP